MHRSTASKKIWIVLTASLVALSCKEEKPARAPSGGVKQGASDSKAEPSEGSAARGNGGLPIGADAAFLDADFNLEVKVFGASICDGRLKIKLNAGIGKKDSSKLFEIPEGIVDCTIYKFDLAQILGSVTEDKPKVDVKDPLVVKDGIISMKALGSGIYEPARPLFPSFLASSRGVLSQLDKQVSVHLEDKKEGKGADGRIRLKVNSFGEPYTAPAIGKTFPDTMQFELGVEGFDGINKIENFIFERMAFVLSLNPIAILHIEFSGPASDLASGAKSAGIDIPKDDSGIVDGLINVIGGLVDVAITLDLVKMERLDEAFDNAVTEGPIVGGESSSN